MITRAIFLDKDGTLVENVPYNVDPDKIRLVEGVKEGLRLLSEAGYALFVVSNQAGVAHGYFKEEDLKGVEARLGELLAEVGVSFQDFYYCPHHPEGKLSQLRMTCFCRKPSPGMLFHAARDHDINLSTSWIVGDILNDVEAGRRADCRTILLDNGGETEWKLAALRKPHFTVKNFLEAVHVILEADGTSPRGAAALPVDVPAAARENRPIDV
jgi:D-glycero-D-manno-heptose 1,7-bisphosphate phosphatase